MTGTQIAARSAATLIDVFERKQPEMEKMLDGTISIDRFMRIVKNAILKDPEVAEADPTSVFLEVQKAAQDGLVLDGREAVLTRFKGQKKFRDPVSGKEEWRTVVNVAYIPMIAGIKKRVMNSGMIKSWSVNLVYERELDVDKELGRRRFAYYAGDNPRIEHEPIIFGDKGDIVAAYSAAKMSDGTYHHEVMTIAQLRAIKSRTKSKKQDGTITGPWATDEDEMFRKTVARRHSKSLPMSNEDRRIVERVDALYDFERDADEVYSVKEDAEPPKPVANKKAGSAADKLKAAKATKSQPEQPAPTDGLEDGETVTIDGEIIPADAERVPIDNDGYRDEMPEDVF